MKWLAVNNQRHLCNSGKCLGQYDFTLTDELDLWMSQSLSKFNSDLEEFEVQLCEDVEVSAEFSRWDPGPSVSSTPTLQRWSWAAGQYSPVCLTQPGEAEWADVDTSQTIPEYSQHPWWQEESGRVPAAPWVWQISLRLVPPWVSFKCKENRKDKESLWPHTPSASHTVTS